MTTLTTPDNICAAFAGQPEKLTFRTLDDGTVLIEGSAKALQFLGNLLISQAGYSEDCGFQISPTGAGSAVFSPQSTHGFYIHCLPCRHSDGAK